MSIWPDDVRGVLTRLESKIQQCKRENGLKESFYRGEAPLKNMGIAVPENLVGVAPVVGWPATVVDTIAERIDFLGFSSSGGHADVLDRATRASGLSLEFAKAITDSLIYGVGFLEFGGEQVGGESRPSVKAVGPESASFEWDATGMSVAAGLSYRLDSQGRQVRYLHFPDVSYFEEYDEKGIRSVVAVSHGYGVAPLVPILNRTRSGRARGNSEITPAVRYATEHGVRTMLGMEYNRELYTAPQRWVTNTYPETVGMSEDNTKRENRKAAWNAAMSSFTAIPPTEVEDDDGQVTLVNPQVGQFSSSPPTPYIEEMRMLTQMIASESGVPVEYLGFVTDNPSSADAIRAKEYRLVKKAELKHRQLSEVLTRMVAPLLYSIYSRERMSEEERADLDVLWRDPATPTRAAMADAGQKWVAAGIAPPRSSVVLDMMGFTPEQQRRLDADWARDTSRSVFVGDLADRAAQARANNPAVAEQAAKTRAEGVSWVGDDSGDDAGGSSGAG